MNTTFKILAPYIPILNSRARIVDLWGGRGRGGSHFGTDYFLMRLLYPVFFRGFFVRQTFNDIKDSLWKDFKDRVSEFEERNGIPLKQLHFNESELKVVNMATGSEIISKGVIKSGQRTAKMKSLAGATHALIEEANELAEDDFVQLTDSIRKAGTAIQIIRLFNPPGRHHWIWKDYHLTEAKQRGYYTAKPLPDRDILSIWTDYKTNAVNLNRAALRDYENHLITRPDYYWNQIRGLISEGARGRIYTGWQVMSPEAWNDVDRPVTYSMDFGYSNDPTVVMACKHQGGECYFKELVYESGLDNIALAKRLVTLGIRSSDRIIADPGAGGDLRIAELRRGWEVDGWPQLRNGFTVYPAIKGAGSVKAGIAAVQSRKVFVTSDSINTLIESREYSWRLDINKVPTDVPEDGYDHSMDAIRYFMQSLINT